MPARHDQVDDPALAATLLVARRGTAYFSRKLAELPDADFAGPSLLPGWTRAHVIAHVAYNARALTRLLEWAATGVETPMYDNAEQRVQEITSGSSLKPIALRHLVEHSNVHLNVEWRDLPADRWAAKVRTAQGRIVPVSETAWMRTREVWIHAVDISNGGRFDDFPPAVIDRLLLDITATWRRRGDGLDLELHATDRTFGINVGDQPSLKLVGTAADLTRWAAGRGSHHITASGEAVPHPPRWL